ncbi:hypothetical protein [Myxococcus eversor]|uniref:hypothetical protein n=1 Tax=Myxococcus eversor TaxID=2709661 RepID=UPI0013D40CC7|nr:hypothetical protein [Myxococcus eversor]
MSRRPSERLRRYLQQWLEQFLLNPSESADQRQLARESGALPLYGDLGGLIAIHPDGTVLTYEWETSRSEVTDERWTVVALTNGCRKHPELRELLPPRTASALDCATCTGTGSLAHSVTCGTCLGLGWHEPEAD